MIKRLLRFPIVLLLAVCADTAFAQEAKNSIEITPFVGLKTFTADSVLKGSSWGVEATYHINMANNQADWVKMLNVRNVDLSFSYRNNENIYIAKRPAATMGFLGDYYGAV